jgi:hypothetical protein
VLVLLLFSIIYLSSEIFSRDSLLLVDSFAVPLNKLLKKAGRDIKQSERRSEQIKIFNYIPLQSILRVAKYLIDPSCLCYMYFQRFTNLVGRRNFLVIFTIDLRDILSRIIVVVYGPLALR